MRTIIGDESSWISSTAAFAQRKVSQLSGWVHPDTVCEGVKIGDVSDEARQWCAFEHADLMEQGLAAGLVGDFLEAPAKDQEMRLCLERSPDRKQYLLTSAEGSCLLLAESCDNGAGYNIFVARDGEPPITVGPMFTLRANSGKDKWTLHANTCDICEKKGKRLCGRRKIAEMRHYTEIIGEGELHCMDMDIPQLSEDGNMEIWCPLCSSGSLVQSESSQLTNRRPKWNARRKTITMDFFGRVKLASAKNFLLASVDKPEKVRLLFGKVGEHQFVLDYHRPLSMVQAFAAAVSSFAWK
jgi:hypothetical protein